MRNLLAALLLLSCVTGFGQGIHRNYYTTNANPTINLQPSLGTMVFSTNGSTWSVLDGTGPNYLFYSDSYGWPIWTRDGQYWTNIPGDVLVAPGIKSGVLATNPASPGIGDVLTYNGTYALWSTPTNVIGGAATNVFHSTPGYGVTIDTNGFLYTIAVDTNTISTISNSQYLVDSKATGLSNTVYRWNVKRYGATGTNNYAQDSPAFKTAISNMIHFGGVVYVPRGSYTDTNTYSIPVKTTTGAHADASHTATEMYFEGDGQGASIVYIAITNANWLQCAGQMPGLRRMCFVDLNPWTGGTTNTLLSATNSPGVGALLIEDVRFQYFWKGADIAAHNTLKVDGIDCLGCYVGLRVGGYSDNSEVFGRADSCVAGLVVGGKYQPDGTYRVAGGHFKMGGGGNTNVVVIGGACSGITVEGYSETSDGGIVAIGYPPGLLPNETSSETATCGSITLKDVYNTQTRAETVVKTYVKSVNLYLNGCRGASNLIESATAAADGTLWKMDNCVWVASGHILSTGVTNYGSANQYTPEVTYSWTRQNLYGVTSNDTTLSFVSKAVTAQANVQKANTVISTNGFSSTAANYTRMPTNTPADGQLLTAAGTAGYTKWADNAGGITTNFNYWYSNSLTLSNLVGTTVVLNNTNVALTVRGHQTNVGNFVVFASGTPYVQSYSDGISGGWNFNNQSNYIIGSVAGNMNIRGTNSVAIQTKDNSYSPFYLYGNGGLVLGWSGAVNPGQYNVNFAQDVAIQRDLLVTNNIISRGGQHYGNAGGLSNSVDLLPGSNIAITTNANKRSFTIASTASGGIAINAPDLNQFLVGTGTTNVYTNKLFATAGYVTNELQAALFQNVDGAFTVSGGDLALGSSGGGYGYFEMFDSGDINTILLDAEAGGGSGRFDGNVSALSYSTPTNAANLTPSYTKSAKVLDYGSTVVFNAPLDADPTKWELMTVLIHNTNGTPIAITPPSGYIVAGTLYCTNFTECVFRHMGNLKSNFTANPWD